MWMKYPITSDNHSKLTIWGVGQHKRFQMDWNWHQFWLSIDRRKIFKSGIQSCHVGQWYRNNMCSVCWSSLGACKKKHHVFFFFFGWWHFDPYPIHINVARHHARNVTLFGLVWKSRNYPKFAWLMIIFVGSGYNKNLGYHGINHLSEFNMLCGYRIVVYPKESSLLLPHLKRDPSHHWYVAWTL
jgi:hypothetical protein